MTTREFQFGIRITADGKVAVSEAGRVEHAIAGIGQAADQSARQAERAYAGVTRLAQVAGTAFSVHELGQAADTWATVNAQLKLATGSALAGTQAYQQVVKTALDAGQALADVSNVYRRFAETANVLGISQAQVAAATQTVAQSIALSGASAEASQAALVQFGQGLASGTLRGEELNSVLEQAPRLAKVLADGLGVPIGRLRELAEQGQLTSDAIVKALLGQSAKVADEFGQLPVTMGRALTNLKTAFTDTVGSFEKSTGVFGGIAKGVDGLAGQMDALAVAAGVVGAVYVGKTVAGLVAATQAKLTASAAARALAAAELQEAQAAATQAAARAAASAMMASNTLATEALAAANTRLAAAQVTAAAASRGAMVLGALGGPIGIVTTALTLGVTAWTMWAGKAEQATAEAARSAVENLDSIIAKVQEMNGRLGETTRKSYDAMVGAGERELKTVKAQMDFLQGQLDAMDQAGGRGRFSEEGKNKQAELNALAAREIVLQKELGEARQKSAEVGTAALNRFIDTNAVGAEKVRVQQTKLLQEFSQAIAATGGVYDASNAAHKRAYDALQAGLAEAAKKGAAKGNNDFAQAIKARLDMERDATKAQVDLVKDRVAAKEVTERDGIERTLAAQQEGFAKEAALLKQQLAGTKDKGERAQILADIQKLGNAAARAAAEAQRGFDRLADISLGYQQEYMKFLLDEKNSLMEKAKAAELENERIGLTAEQLAELTRRRYDEQIAIKQMRAEAIRSDETRSEELAVIEQQIEALKRLRDAESARPLLEARSRYWQDFFRELERGTTDGIFRGLEKGGKDGAKIALEAVINTFKAAPIKLLVEAVVSPVFSGIGQAFGINIPNAAAGNPLVQAYQAYNGLSSLNSMFSQGVGTLAGNAVSMTGNLVGSTATSAFGAGMGLTGAQAAAAAAQYQAAAAAASAAGNTAAAATYSQVATSLQAGSTAGAVASYAGGIGAGYTLGTLISGGRGVLGNGSSAAVGTGTAIGAFFGPVGAIVGGVIGGLVNAAFGSGPKKVTGAGLQGEFTAAGFEGVNYQDWRKKGGWFSGGSSGTNTSGLSAEQQAFYNAAVAGMASPYLALQAAAGGAPLTDRMGAFSYSVRRNIGSEADITALLKDVSNALGEQLLPELENFRQKDEALADTAARLGNVFAATNTLADILGQNMEDAFGALGIASAGVRQSLVDAAGGLDAFKAGVQSYYQDYYSQEEQLARSRAAVTQQLASVGLELPSSKEGFRALVESLDKTTSTGQRAFTVMMQVERAFAEIADAAAGAGAVVGSLADQIARTQAAAVGAIEVQASAAEDAARNARQAADSYRQASAAIADAIVQLRGGDLSPLSPQQKLAEQDQRLSALFAQALAGDLGALGQLSGAASDYLTASRAYNASGSAYAADFDRVMGLLQQAGVASDTGALKSDYQGTLLELQVEALQEIRAQLASPSPDAAILAEQKALLDAIGEALRNQNSLTLTGNATNDAIRYLTGANNSLSEEMLRSLVGGTSVQTQTLENILSGSDQAVDLLQQLVDLGQQKAVQDAAAKAADEQARAEAAAVLKATGAYESQKAIADALRATWDQTVAAFGVRQDGSYTAEDISAGQAASYAYYTHYTGEDYKVSAAREANAAYLAAFQKAYELYQAIPGHADGLEHVPYDNYMARLHEGEAVVDAGAMASIRRYFGVTPRTPAPADNGKTVAEARKQTGHLEALVRQFGTALPALLGEVASMREELKILRKTSRRWDTAPQQ
ncbi:MAG TPA: tape measure protein [Rhodocyclaceae bacterium]|nr:tape measure protein [Rhodocyclaceae bacterium]